MRRGAIFRRSILIVTLILCVQAPTLAIVPAVDFGCAKPLRVGIAEFGPLYEAGQGADIELLAEISRRSGCRFEIVAMSRVDIWSALEEGEIDLATNQVSTQQRLQLARFIFLHGIKNMMIVPNAKGAASTPFRSFVDRQKARLGLVRGYRYGNFYDFHLKSLLGDARVVEFATHRELFDALRHDAVQAILTAPINYYYFLDAQERINFSLIDPSPAPPTPSGFALSRRSFSAGQADNWLRILESMRLDHTIHEMLSRHLSSQAMEIMQE